ncbi:MAG: prepilin-type N-terminal cleavage/methylation domain-containing protein [Bacteroidales bacterium]|nr:prepilin-type N-terminal cleavage/methylation domain-containing protein [Bacteroidales bacterium]
MNNKSFTLIELLVVIVVIGILAGVIMISTSSSIDKANIAKVKVFEESVQNNLAANMVSAWDADHVTKGTTWILNDKWGSNNGTFYDSTSTACTTSLCPQIVTDNQMGNVLSFDGVNDSISITSNDSLNIIKSITISAWVKITGGAIILSKTVGAGALNNPYDFRTNGAAIPKLVLVRANDLTFSVKESLSSITEKNHWNSVAITVDSLQNYNFYINGINVGSGAYAFTPTENNNPVLLGKRDDGWGFFNGLMNDIRIYNAALSSSQIKQNYIAGLNSMLSNETISKEEYKERINELAYEQK